MTKFLFVLLIITTNLLVGCDNKSYYANKIEIFKESPVWSLAKAVDEHNLEKMEELLKEHPDWVDYKETKFGISLLYWTMYNSPRKWDEYFYEEAKLLIDYGANPYYLLEDNSTPIMRAASVHTSSVKFIQLCLDSKFTKELSDSLKRRLLSEALIVACGKIKEEVEGVKLLVESGADVNYYTRDSVRTPFSESITQDNMEIAKYLVINEKAKYDIYVKRMIDGVDLSMLKRLQDLDFSEEPEKENIRQEILAYIEEQKK